MQTPSHFLLTAAVGWGLEKRYGIRPLPIPLLLGSILPDIPFFLLTAGYEAYFRWFAPLPSPGSIMEYLHLTLFFTDPVWIVGHQLFHSLLINGCFLAVGFWGMRRDYHWARMLFWLGIGTQFHTVIDILTHHSDGPLLFFPFNWTYRFPSPISYWETAFYARPFIFFEIGLDLLIGAFFVRNGWRR